MKIEILYTSHEPEGFRYGFVDFKVIHSDTKWEIFRGIKIHEKDGKRWLSLGSIQREGKWLPKYERNSPLKEIFGEVLRELKVKENS